MQKYWLTASRTKPAKEKYDWLNMTSIVDWAINLVLLNKLKIPHPLLIFGQLDYLIQVVHTNSST